jgi:CheY-like chemotaxis protein
MATMARSKLPGRTLPLAGLEALLVEDEATVSLLIEDMLRDLGAISIRLAEGVSSALDLLLEHRPAIAVLDVNLGGEAVYPVAEKLERRNIPFVFVTGYARDAIDRRWANRPFVQKPFRLAALDAALRVALDHGDAR